MDNVTHTLAGLLAAEVAVQHRGGREAVPRHWPRWAYLVSALANNLPDADIVYISITGGKIGYLAHHRGHTHTLAFALAVAGLALAAAWWARRRGRGSTDDEPGWSERDRGSLVALAVIGPLLHLAMDGANNYGVHPFWPLDSRWFYGDTMFIIEPLLWGSVGPVLVAAVSSRIGKGVLALIALAGVVLSWVTGYVPPPLAVGLTLWTASFTVLAWRASPRRRAALGAGAALFVYALFLGTGARARQDVTASVAEHFPKEELVDAALTPMPANPLCWRVATWSLAGDQVVLRRGNVTPFSLTEPAMVCPETREGFTAPLEAMPSEEGSAKGPVAWDTEGSYPLEAIRELWEKHCHARAFLRWSRLPFTVDRDGQRVLGDLRYDREPSLGFAEIALPDASTPCPAHVPAWVPPRERVLVP